MSPFFEIYFKRHLYRYFQAMTFVQESLWTLWKGNTSSSIYLEWGVGCGRSEVSIETFDGIGNLGNFKISRCPFGSMKHDLFGWNFGNFAHLGVTFWNTWGLGLWQEIWGVWGWKWRLFFKAKKLDTTKRDHTKGWRFPSWRWAEVSPLSLSIPEREQKDWWPTFWMDLRWCRRNIYIYIYFFFSLSVFFVCQKKVRTLPVVPGCICQVCEKSLFIFSIDRAIRQQAAAKMDLGTGGCCWVWSLHVANVHCSLLFRVERTRL